MREDLEAVAARDGDERDAGPLGGADRERRRRRDRDDARRADHRRLLHHLDRHAAGQQHDAVDPRASPARASAPTSLSSALCRPTSSRTATRPGLAAARTPRHERRASARLSTCAWRQRVERRADRRGREHARRRRRVGSGRIASSRLSMPQRPQPVGPARCRRRSRERRRARLGEPHAQLDAGLDARRSRAGRISVRRGDDAFGQAEADREILEVARRRHHHRVGRAVVDEGDGGLLRRSMRSPSVDAPARRQVGATASSTGAQRLLRGLDRRARCAGSCAQARRIASCHSRRAVRRRDLDRGHLVFGAVGRPVGIFGGDDVGLRVRDGGRSCRPRPARRAR